MSSYSCFVFLAAVCAATRGVAAFKVINDIGDLHDSVVVNLQDSKTDLQHNDVTLQDPQDSEVVKLQGSDVDLQDSVVVNLQDSKTDLQHNDVTLQDPQDSEVVKLQGSDVDLQDSVVVNLQDSKTDLQHNDITLQDPQDSEVVKLQGSDVDLQDSVVVDLQDSKTDQQHSDYTLKDSDIIPKDNDVEKLQGSDVDLQDSVVVDLQDSKIDEERTLQNRDSLLRKGKKDTGKKSMGIAFPSTDLKNPKEFLRRLHGKVSEFKEAYESEIEALNGLQVIDIKRDRPVTKIEAALEILCIIEQLCDIIPGTEQFVTKMVRFHGPKYGFKSFNDFSIIRKSAMSVYMRDECKVTNVKPRPLSMLRPPVQLHVKNLLIYLILAELEYNREIKRNIA